MGNSDAARTVAHRLQAIAETMSREPSGDRPAATLMNAFLAAARALATTDDPPPLHQVLALVQVLTAGFEKLSANKLPPPDQVANDVI